MTLYATVLWLYALMASVVLGASVYELLTSKPPFYSGNVDRQIREQVPPSLTQRRKELGVDGTPIDSYVIPFDEHSTNIISIEAPPPVVMPPAIAEPLETEGERKKKDEERKLERGHGFGSIS